MSYGRPYLREERVLIARQQRSRAPLRETAALLGRGYAGVKSFASDAGLLQEPKWSDSDTALLQAFGRAGWTLAEIAERLRRSPRAVSQRLHRLRTSLAQLRSETAS